MTRTPPTARPGRAHGAALLSLVLALSGCRQGPAEEVRPAEPVPAEPPGVAGALSSTVLAGGCFWCTEAVFEELRGVEEVVSGYAGGSAENANYAAVSGGRSDHAEAIRVSYDPGQISFERLLEVFFSVAHDPTQLNYQGPDHGRQYRSAVFFADEAERHAVETYILQLREAQVFEGPIVTTLEPLHAFYPAEDYHQDYVRHNPRQAYVVRFSRPKLSKLREHFPELLKPELP